MKHIYVQFSALDMVETIQQRRNECIRNVTFFLLFQKFFSDSFVRIEILIDITNDKLCNIDVFYAQ